MNNLHSNERHLADKLRNVPAPDVDRSWEQMKKLLERDMPEGGGAAWSGNRKWWWMGITAGVVMLAVWLTQQISPSGDRQLADKEIINNSVPGEGTSNTSANKTDNNKTSITSNDQNTTQTVTDPSSINNNSSTSAGSDNRTSDNKKSVSPGVTAPVSSGTSIAQQKTSDNNQPPARVSNKDNQDSKNIGIVKNSVAKDVRNSVSRDNMSGKNASSVDDKRDIALSGTGVSSSKNNTGVAKSEQVSAADDKISVSKSNDDMQVVSAGKNSNGVSLADNKPASTQKDITLSDKDIAGSEVKGDSHQSLSADQVTTSSLAAEERNIKYAKETTVAREVIDGPANVFATAEFTSTDAYAVHKKTDRVSRRLLRQQGMKEDNRRMSRSGMRGSAGEKDHEITFAAGLTVPQTFAVGSQQPSSYNIAAKMGRLPDYLPAPFFQYHINPRLFLQTELHFQAPQYTQRLLLSQVNMSSIPTANLQSNVYLEKLYYFNVPFNVYYSPARNFFIGGGLQYSSLLSGVATYEDKRTIGNTQTTSSVTRRFKDDSLASRFAPTEWRYQMDANYYFKRFTLGLRYNQAMKDFANFQVNSSMPPTQARNQSFLLYLRFNIWEERKKD